MRLTIRLVAAVGVAALLLRLAAGRAAAQTADQISDAERARRAYAALMRDFALPPDERGPLLRGQGEPYAYLWPLSQALAGALALAGMPGGDARAAADLPHFLATIADYWDARVPPPGFASFPPPPLGRGGDLFYDDNGWAGLDLIEYHRQTGDPGSLAAARAVFDFLVSGWDTDPEHPAPGGIFWVRADYNGDRNTVSTAPAALLGLHLYELTREPLYWQWSMRMIGWLNSYLLSPEGLYWDHVRMDAIVDTSLRTYNQGAMIGASLAMHRITGDGAYLRWAEGIAQASMRRWADDRLHEELPGFNAILCRYLLALWVQTGNSAYRRFVEEYADQAWHDVRGPGDRFRFPLRGAQSEYEQALIGQAAIVQIEALLVWPAAALLRLV